MIIKKCSTIKKIAKVEPDGKVRQLELLITTRHTPIAWTELDGTIGNNTENSDSTRNNQPQRQTRRGHNNAEK